MTKNCFISYADGIHVPAQNRLRESIIKIAGDKYDILFWTDKLPEGSPSFTEAPYAFKAFAFLEAKKLGYKNILWVDASLILIRDPEKIFKLIEDQGYFLYSSKISKVGNWSSDVTLENLKISRTEALRMTELHACILGLNAESEVANKFLKSWAEIAKDGSSFRGSRQSVDFLAAKINKDNLISKDNDVWGHRCDQTVGSILAKQLEMKISTKYVADNDLGAKKPIPLNSIFRHDHSYKNTNNNSQLIVPDKYDNKVGIRKYIYIAESSGYTLARDIIRFLR